MVPASFDEANVVLGKPPNMGPDTCDPLTVLRTTNVNDLPVVISCWKMTPAEMEEVQRTGRVWLVVVGHTMPPVAIDGCKPF